MTRIPSACGRTSSSTSLTFPPFFKAVIDCSILARENGSFGFCAKKGCKLDGSRPGLPASSTATTCCPSYEGRTFSTCGAVLGTWAAELSWASVLSAYSKTEQSQMTNVDLPSQCLEPWTMLRLNGMLFNWLPNGRQDP